MRLFKVYAGKKQKGAYLLVKDRTAKCAAFVAFDVWDEAGTPKTSAAVVELTQPPEGRGLIYEPVCTPVIVER